MPTRADTHRGGRHVGPARREDGSVEQKGRQGSAAAPLVRDEDGGGRRRSRPRSRPPRRRPGRRRPGRVPRDVERDLRRVRPRAGSRLEQRRRRRPPRLRRGRSWPGCRSVDLVHPDDLASRPWRCSTRPPVTSSRPGSSRGTGARTAPGAGWSGRPGCRPAPGFVYGAARDVTDRAPRPGRHRRRNEARLQAILDHSTAAIFVKDRRGRYVVVNEVFLRAFGLRNATTSLGKTVAEIWPGADVDDDDLRVLDARRGLHPRRRRDARRRHPHHDDDAVPAARRARARSPGWPAIATDITEWTEVQAALAERQRLLDTVIRACPDIVTVLDADGQVREISEASARILGYDLADPRPRARSRPSSIPTTSPGSTRSPPRSSRCPTAQLDLTVPGPSRRRSLGRPRHSRPGDGGGRRAPPWGRWWCRATSPTSSRSRPRCTSPWRRPSRPARPRATSCRA